MPRANDQRKTKTQTKEGTSRTAPSIHPAMKNGEAKLPRRSKGSLQRFARHGTKASPALSIGEGMHNTKRQAPSPLAMIDGSTNLEGGRRPRTTTDACKKHKPSQKRRDQPSKSGDTLPHPNTDRARGMQQPIVSKDSSVPTDNDPTAGSPTVTLLRLLLPLNDKVQ